MFQNVTSPKWALDSEDAARFVVAAEIVGDDYLETWVIAAGTSVELRFTIRWPKWGRFAPWKTDGGRLMGLAGGERLGGYIGASLDREADGTLTYHIGTPSGRKSGKLIEAMKVALAAASRTTAPTPEYVAEVFKVRNELLEIPAIVAGFIANLEKKGVEK